MAELRQGTIVRARIVPTRGEAKFRPAIIYTPDDLIPTLEIVKVVGITTSYVPGEPAYVPLPWRDDGRIHTKLRCDCAIAFSLLASLEKQQLQPTGGYLRSSDAAFLDMIARLKSMSEL